ncbi:MAG: tetratricopeptide repeat protein [bacterium]
MKRINCNKSLKSIFFNLLFLLIVVMCMFSGCSKNGTEGDHDRTMADYTKAIEINPKDADAYYHRGLILMNGGEYSQAIADFTKAIEIDPKYADAYNSRGAAYAIKGEFERAWEDVYQAQSLGYEVDQEFFKVLREATGR